MTSPKGGFWRPTRDGNTEAGRKQFALGPDKLRSYTERQGVPLKERKEKVGIFRENLLTEVGWID